MAAPLPKNAWQETFPKKLFKREPWMTDAECAGHPRPQIFFPDRNHAQALFREAREVCAQCPVWRDCLNYALRNFEGEGIWGGLSIRERRVVRHSDGVRKCKKCGLIRVFPQKAQMICDSCNFQKLKKLG